MEDADRDRLSSCNVGGSLAFTDVSVVVDDDRIVMMHVFPILYIVVVVSSFTFVSGCNSFSSYES